jgi:hypothetical protein
MSGGYYHPIRLKSRDAYPEFPDFLAKAVVHEKHSTTWEFGKGALSANVYFFNTHYQDIGAAANPVMG